METEVKKLQGLEVYEIAMIDKDNKFGESTKLAGETFRRYRYNGIVFTVRERDPFNVAYDAGKLASVKLIKSKRTATVTDEDGESKEVEVDSIAYDSCITTAQEVGYKKHQAQLTRIEKVAIATELSDENVDKLLNAIV